MKSSILDNVHIVLCNTSHQGNLGAAARAMKTMGITKLTLVNPVNPPDDHAIALACNASDVLQNAKIVDSLDLALEKTVLAYALTSRKREFNYSLQTPRESLSEIFGQLSQNNQVAIVFGSEKSGLTIQQLEKCNRLMTIPGNPEYFSLNLSQAVQIICYELYSNYTQDIQWLKTNTIANNPSSYADNQGVLASLDQILQQANFYQNKRPAQVQQNLQRIIHKAHLQRNEVDLLRGILKTIQQNLIGS